METKEGGSRMSKHTRTRLPEGTTQVRNASTGEVKQVGDIKMSDVFDLPVEASEDFDDMEVEASISLDLVDKYAEAAVHAINNHDDLVKKVAELKKALIEVSEQTIDLFAYTIDEVNYYTGLISDCLVNDEVGTIRTMVKVALKESE